jgi:hypothetical protein
VKCVRPEFQSRQVIEEQDLAFSVMTAPEETNFLRLDVRNDPAGPSDDWELLEGLPDRSAEFRWEASRDVVSQ